MSDFQSFAAQQDARNTIQLNIVKYCWMLTDALRQNYIQYAVKGHQSALNQPGANEEYHNACITDLQNGHCPIDYQIHTGRKYHKIVFVDGGGQRSVHCFVDKHTGEVYKSASWNAPAKGVRYNLLLIKDREWLYEHADWSGGYLYAR